MLVQFNVHFFKNIQFFTVMLIICFLMYAGVSSFDAKMGQPNHPSFFFTVFFLYVKSGGGFQTFLRLEE